MYMYMSMCLRACVHVCTCVHVCAHACGRQTGELLSYAASQADVYRGRWTGGCMCMHTCGTCMRTQLASLPTTPHRSRLPRSMRRPLPTFPHPHPPPHPHPSPHAAPVATAMFHTASSFNQDIGMWQVHKVTDMECECPPRPNAPLSQAPPSPPPDQPSPSERLALCPPPCALVHAWSLFDSAHA